MWIFQNTFASTETQRHVKPLRMIDEVCFEMADIKQTRLKMEYVTISKSEHDFLVTQAKRIKLR